MTEIVSGLTNNRDRQTFNIFNISDRLLLVAFVIVYLLILHFSYVKLISPIWGYMGFIYNNPSFFTIFLTWVIATIPALWMPIDIKRPSQIIYWVFYTLIIIPIVIVPVYISGTLFDSFIKISLPILISFAIISLIYKIPLLKARRLHIPYHNHIFWLVLLTILLINCIYIIAFFGSGLKLVNLFSSEEVYSLRLSAREVIQGGIIGYIILWCFRLINPFLIAFGLNSKKYIFVIAGILAQVLIYSIDASKGVLLLIFILLGLYFILRKGGRKAGMEILMIVICLIVISYVSDYISNTNIFISLGVRREILIHGLLTDYYFDFFSKNPKAYLGYNRILQDFVDYPYSYEPPFVIGEYYFNNPATNANENFWAYGFADFGYPGVFILGFIVAGIFWLCDSLSVVFPIKFSALLLFSPLFSLGSTSLFTSLLSHGIIFLLIFLWIIPKDIIRNKNGK